MAAKKRKPLPPPDMWRQLYTYIHAYTEAAIADSWKGGGDPADFDIRELQLKISRLELTNHIVRMREELT